MKAPLLIMKSDGGVTSAPTCVRQPIQTVLSGPAAGVIGAVSIARSAGFADVISIDVGGTSADICLVRNGRPEITKDGMVGAFPLKLPILDIHTIGAGGGSIASVSAAGRLTVGPRSAGAEPGPACYGRGGLEPTVTDAHLALGRIPAGLLGGELPLDVAAARAVIGERVARPLGLSVEEAAAGIVEIIDNAMARAIRTVSVGRGHDPRRFALIPFGGAGPLHGCRLAELLEIPSVIIPPRPGVLSTWGLLDTDIRATFVRTVGIAARRAAAAEPSLARGGVGRAHRAGPGLALRRADPARSPALRAERGPPLRAPELRADVSVSARGRPGDARAPRRADRDVPRRAPAALHLRPAARAGRAGEPARDRGRHPAEAGGATATAPPSAGTVPPAADARAAVSGRAARVLPRQRRRHGARPISGPASPRA